MSALLPLKKLIERLPLPLKKLVSLIPFGSIVGQRYSRLSARLHGSGAFLGRQSLLAETNEVLDRIQRVPFFKSKLECYPDEKFKGLDELLELPITAKRDLLLVPPEQRAVESTGRYLVK